MEEGGSSGTTTTSTTSYLMGFGDNNNNSSNSSSSITNVEVYPYSSYPYPLMMMPLITSSSSSSSSSSCFHQNNNNAPLFLPTNNTTNHHLQQHPMNPGAPPSPLMLHQNYSYFLMDNSNNNNDGSSSSNNSSVKAKIMAHPHYHRLLAAYLNCQKVGAPAEVVARLEEACAAKAAATAEAVTVSAMGCIGEDPALDQFMEAYCEMLTKYHQELSKPFNEAMLFLSRIDSQFKALALTPSPHLPVCGEAMDRTGSSEEEVDVNNGLIDPQAEDRDLKVQLFRKYSGYLGSLKQEFMKKRKKGKLPKEARQQLLDWWSRHYKWPYPSESQKLALAEATGLDQKQINNWFINQRKRHWKPSEDMQFVVMDGGHPHYYMDHVLGNPFPMDISPPLL